MAAQGAVYVHHLHTYFPESARIVYDLDRNRVPVQSSPVHTPLCTCRRRVATHHSSRIRRPRDRGCLRHLGRPAACLYYCRALLTDA